MLESMPPYGLLQLLISTAVCTDCGPGQILRSAPTPRPTEAFGSAFFLIADLFPRGRPRAALALVDCEGLALEVLVKKRT